MAISTMFIPHGWQVQGGVVWGQQYLCTNGYAISWTATAPDGYSQQQQPGAYPVQSGYPRQ